MAFTVSFIAYTLLIVAIGVYSARYAKGSDEDYFLAGRSLGPWVAALSASASSESGWVTLGLVGIGFTTGFSAYWIVPGCVLGFIFNWFIVAGRMRDHAWSVRALTIPDFFAHTFNERRPVLRIVSVIVILTAMWLYVGAQFSAAGEAFAAAFTGIEYWVGVVLGTLIVLAYTVLGGFRAACWTDFIQGLMMVGTLVVFPLYLVTTQHGFGFISESLATADPELTRWMPEFTGDFWVFAMIGFLLSSGALGINFGYPGQPHVLVRFMALRERNDAVVGGFVSATWALLVLSGAITIGMIVRALMIQAGDAPDEQWLASLSHQIAAGAGDAGENGLVLAAKNLIPGVISGMVLAAVLAAICSTADSQLVVAASSAANDIYSRLIDHSAHRAHMLVNRLTVFALGLGAFLLVVWRENIAVFDFVLTYGWAVLGASFGPQVILILLWKRASYAGCVAGMITGFAVALIWPNIYTAEVVERTSINIYNLPLAFILALIVNVIVSSLVPGPSDNNKNQQTHM